jgi:hypothetical protein
MTESFDEYGEVLRRALRAEADQVMPSMEGLERIRSRTQGKAPAGWAAWFAASWTRPLMAVGAAVVLALLAVSAPPAINHITSFASHQGSAPHRPRTSPGDGTSGDVGTNAVPPGGLPSRRSQPAVPPVPGAPGSQSPCLFAQTPDSGQSTAKKSPTPSPSPSGRPDRNPPPRTPGLPICPDLSPSAEPSSGRPDTSPSGGSPTPSAPPQGPPPGGAQQVTK